MRKRRRAQDRKGAVRPIAARSKGFACRALALLGGVWIAVAAMAQGGRERPRYVLQALDVDHDGQLSADEMQRAPGVLLTLDRNGDGALAADEMEAPRTDAGATPDQLVTQLMQFDRNGDGTLTQDEMPERMRSLFARGDTDGNGKLTPEEIRHLAEHTGSPNGRPTEAGKAAGMMRMDPVLNALDTNHDGTLSPSEIQGARAALAALDLDHDGTIEAAEMRVRQQSPAERAAHVLEEFDTDRDGRVSKAEAPDGLRPRFADADANGDGFLDQSELLQLFTAMQQAPADGHAGVSSEAQPQSSQPAPPTKP